ncbi:hypothetical protein THAOC_29044 [Thalassiosira oceanica]|uniref:Uncharacterized protein n=1 Tax=Thalassiosira oceanica TaxID=159749 RepID=K0RS78_THAOC|nr:hypothetical protein THAOC_29044 [Thalassiosira oceanica]|eukprot:EJK51756.1 hypothetical protein THAOC_29044 [Thalassiosira oceanica]
MGSGKTPWKSTSSSSVTAVLICSAEISPILQCATCSLARIKSSGYTVPWNPSRPLDPFTHNCLCSIPRGSGKTTWEPTPTSTFIATPCFRSEISLVQQPGTPQIKRVYGAMNPLLAYTLAPMHLPAFHIPRASGKTTWEPVSTSTPTAVPCFHAEISGSEPPGTPQIKRVYGAMNPLLAYTLAPMPLPAFPIPS